MSNIDDKLNEVLNIADEVLEKQVKAYTEIELAQQLLDKL